jgi:uroporphyrinogen decarboxylase
MRKALGDIVMLEAMCQNPGWIHDFCQVVTDNILMHMGYILDNIGRPDGIWIYEDMGYRQAPFVSPGLYREMIFPYHKKTAEFIHSYNLPFILHSCGRIRPLLPDIMDAGIDCLQALEVKAGQDVLEMAEAAENRISFMGNIDIRAFESNSKDTIHNEIVPKLKAVRKRRIPFIFHSDHSIPSSVSLQSYTYALECFRFCCQY